MKNVLVFILCATLAFGSVTPTSHIGLSKVTPGTETGTWGPIINANYDLIDSYLGGVLPLPVLSLLNGVTYVGEGSKFAGDIGAQLISAITALPSPGGKIVIVPKADGSCYDFSTSVPMIVSGKYALIEYGGSSGFLGASTPQGCLNWTPTSGSAFTIDYSTLTGIPAGSAFGLRNISLVNNNCVSNGGCGGTAIGIDSGTTNAGDSQAVYDNVSISGFFVGYRNLGSPSHFGTLFHNPSFIHNATALLLKSPSPIVLAYGTYAGNTTVIKTSDSTASPGVWAVFMDAFNNTTIVDATASVSPNIGQFLCNYCHFEANDISQGLFISGAIDPIMNGGVAEVDTGGGTLATMFNLSGTYVNIDRMQFASTATVTAIVTANGAVFGQVGGEIKGANFSAPYVNGASAALVDKFLKGDAVHPQTYIKDLFVLSPEFGTGNGLLCDEGGTPPAQVGKAVIYCDSGTHTLKASFNNGSFLNLSQVITTSLTTTAATTDNVTVTGMTASGHCTLNPTNSAAAAGIASVFVSNKTTDQITVTHTATSGWTFDVVCTPQ